MDERRAFPAAAGLVVVWTTLHAVQSPGVSAPAIVVPPGSAAIEQTAPGSRPSASVVASFDGLGAGFAGPQGSATLRNPSDNSLAVGPNHIVQTVNTRMAVFTKKGQRFDMTGKPLYGPVPTNNVFKGFGGACESRNNGDAVVRYDQIADRWLIVMPVFSRGVERPDQPRVSKGGDSATVSPAGRAGQPGLAMPLFQPPTAPASATPDAGAQNRAAGRQDESPKGPYSMCYAMSTGSDPLGGYYRYEFLRPLFPDYPRPAIWSDGYYVPTSTSDDRISDTVATEKHACVVERARMLAGEPASEQCVIVENVNFLNNADIDGKSLPPPGAPNVMMAAGGTQLDHILEAEYIHVWHMHVDWKHPGNTRVTGPQKIHVAPYRYLCDGQLSNCVPQPGIDRRLDAQGDKLMARLVYRRSGNQESMVAVHAVNTAAGGGGVRWYEFRIDARRDVTVFQQGTYAPDRFFRWLASPAIDRLGNIGIGYSFGGTPSFPGQRFAGRLAGDPPGQLTLRETVLVEGEGAQDAMRWEDYTQTAIDPSDDCTIWYVGDYLRKGAELYSSRIGAFRLPGCG
jgi:hypothetical protein